ncbi:glycosyltransferase [Spiribacter halobius]|uniref:Glycosyl transferase n=1 Tax=Sediminicurvatus halobius TaxID=2182432 RepID=A0A2U2N4G9_9GAMM|nr:glycosyltransferase [Spiribacter halobius]PWG63864.1 glycosyl transferase [Spiribacter halobius]UEX76267.1 glycosyltransferase [Spiribacter halobius]
MTTAPAVSVVLPVRDGGHCLATAAASILDQTRPDLELLVVDDGSRDGAVAALPPEPRLRRLAARGRGIVAALNTGLAAAQAPVIARMDADDVARPDRLARQLALLQAEPDVDIVGAEVRIVTDHGSPGAGYRRYEAWINDLRTPSAIAAAMFVESPIPHPTAVMRRTALERLGGYREAPWAEDYDLWLRAHLAGCRMAKPAGVLLDWHDGPHRLSRRDPRCSDAAFTAARAHYLIRGPAARRPLVIWGAGTYGGRLCDALVREGGDVRAFIDIDPRRIGGHKRNRPVQGPGDPLPPRALVLAAVRSAGARERIAAHLTGRGLREGTDFIAAG